MATIRTFTVTAALVMLTLAGCSRDEGPDPDRGLVPVSFSASRHTEVAGSLSRSEPATRTTNGGNEWLGTDKVGIFMLSAGGSLPGNILTVGGTTADNRKFNVDPVTEKLTADDGGALYYPQSGNVDFIAYYPHGDAVASSTTAGEVNSTNYTYNISVADQSTQANQNALDVLYSNNATNVAKSKTAVELQFDHVMSKITLNVKAGDGFTEANIQTMVANDIKFGGMPVTATLKLADGTVTAGATGDFSPLKGTVPGGATYNATFTAILVPQAGGGNSRTVTFTVGGQEYKWPVPDTGAFEAGNHYSYPVTVKKTGVSVGQATITPWDELSPETGETGRAVIQPEANCYMVAPGGLPILIPVSQANRVLGADGLGAKTDGLGGVAAGNFTVELVWGDRPIGSGEVIEAISATEYNGEGYVLVIPGPTEGNMVIAIKDKGNKNIKWSWHIWVTDEVTSATDDETGLTWMDRNLGATSNTPYVGNQFDNDQWIKTLGLFYQWGRKDAFPGSDGTDNGNQTYYTLTEPNGTTDDLPTGSYTQLPVMVQNPLRFSTKWDEYRGSTQINEGNDSWGGETGEKTLYDPCPPGWKVPPISVDSKNVWGNYNDPGWQSWNNYGRIFNGVNGNAGLGHYYPASGNRNYSTGQLNNQGTYGYYWSATTNTSSLGYNLAFYSGSVNPAGSGNRTTGFSVRCVAAL